MSVAAISSSGSSSTLPTSFSERSLAFSAGDAQPVVSFLRSFDLSQSTLLDECFERALQALKEENRTLLLKAKDLLPPTSFSEHSSTLSTEDLRRIATLFSLNVPEPTSDECFERALEAVKRKDWTVLTNGKKLLPFLLNREGRSLLEEVIHLKDFPLAEGLVSHKIALNAIGTIGLSRHMLAARVKEDEAFFLLKWDKTLSEEAKKVLGSHEEALEKVEALYIEEDQLTIARSLSILGVPCGSFLGEGQKVGLDEKALIATSLNNLGAAWLCLGRTQKAVAFFEEAIKIGFARKKDFNIIGTSLNNLGAAWLCLGRTQKAVAFFEEAIKIGEVLYPNRNCPNIIADLNNLGVAYASLGDTKKVNECFEPLQKIQQITPPDESNRGFQQHIFINIKYESFLNYRYQPLVMF